MNKRYSVELMHPLDEGDHPILYETDNREEAVHHFNKFFFQYMTIDGYTVYLRDREELTIQSYYPMK